MLFFGKRVWKNMKHASIILLTNNMKAHYILIAALCGLAGCREDNGAADAANRREMPPLKVSVMNMEQRTVELKSSWFGHLRGVEQADIRPQVSGTLIRQVYWDGSICDKGELLFEIDPATYQAAVDREAANLATARAVQGAAPNRTAPAKYSSANPAGINDLKIT